MGARWGLAAQVVGNLRRLGQSRAASSDASNSSNRVVFSGIQPTGVPHLGNYLGALQQWKRMQDEATPGTKLIYSIVDFHAITVPQQAAMLRQWKREMMASLLAIGLDPDRSIIFYQSSVSPATVPWDKRRRREMLIPRHRSRPIRSSCGY